MTQLNWVIWGEFDKGTLSKGRQGRSSVQGHPPPQAVFTEPKPEGKLSCYLLWRENCVGRAAKGPCLQWSLQGGSLAIIALTSDSFLSPTSCWSSNLPNLGAPRWSRTGQPWQDREQSREEKREGSAGTNRRYVLLLCLSNVFCSSFIASHI